MKKSVIAVLSHCCKSNEDENDKDDVEELRHIYCPRGEESWCRWQRDKGNRQEHVQRDIKSPNSNKKTYSNQYLLT